MNFLDYLWENCDDLSQRGDRGGAIMACLPACRLPFIRLALWADPGFTAIGGLFTNLSFSAQRFWRNMNRRG